MNMEKIEKKKKILFIVALVLTILYVIGFIYCLFFEISAIIAMFDKTDNAEIGFAVMIVLLIPGIIPTIPLSLISVIISAIGSKLDKRQKILLIINILITIINLSLFLILLLNTSF